MSIRVWITSYNEPELLALCIRSWLHYTDFPITVVDNSTPAIALGFASERVTVLPASSNLGHATAMEMARGAKEARIIFSDQDVEVLAPITEDMLPEADLSGVPVSAFIDPLYGFITVARFHSSFLVARTETISHMGEVRIPFEGATLRYDTAALAYHSAASRAVLSDDLQSRFIHYFTDSSKTYFENAPQDMKDYIALARRTATERLNGTPTPTDPVRQLYSSLWSKYCPPVRIACLS